MPQLEIDRQPAAVKHFFGTLSPGVSEFTINGKAVTIRVTPGDRDTEWTEEKNGSEKWTPERNARRCALIDKQFDGGLTIEETEELAALTSAMRKHVNEVAPVPLEETRKLYRELLESTTTERKDA